MAQAGRNLDSRVGEAHRQLVGNGFAVIPNVLTEAECDEYITQIHAWLATFPPGHFPKNINSIIHAYGVGYMDAVIRVRLRTKPVFEELWGTKKLWSSNDGIAIGEPPEISTEHRFGTETDHNLHYDQGDKRVGLHAFQGAVYLEDADEKDWCFMVLPKSHVHHEEFYQNFKVNERSEFRPLKVKELEWFRRRGCLPARVTCPKGGMILWDSRTVHSGAKPLAARAAPRWRYVIFSCMTPAHWATDQDREEKLAAYQSGRLTRHWPSSGVEMFRQYKATPQDLPMPEIVHSEEVMQLLGVTPYDWEDGEPNGPPAPVWTTDTPQGGPARTLDKLCPGASAQ